MKRLIYLWFLYIAQVFHRREMFDSNKKLYHDQNFKAAFNKTFWNIFPIWLYHRNVWSPRFDLSIEDKIITRIILRTKFVSLESGCFIRGFKKLDFSRFWGCLQRYFTFYEVEDMWSELLNKLQIPQPIKHPGGFGWNRSSSVKLEFVWKCWQR